MGKTTVFKKEAAALEEEIISYWVGLLASSGNFGLAADPHGKDSEPVMIGRRYCSILWSISAAYMQTPEEKFLIAATKAKDLILGHFVDNKYGGIHATIGSDLVRRSTDKLAETQAAAINGLAKYVAAFGDDNTLKYAVGLFKSVEKELKDDRLGGYIDVASRSFEDILNPNKTLKTHIRLLDAYTTLYKVYPQADLKEAIKALTRLILDKFVDGENGIVREFNGDWSESAGYAGAPLSLETAATLLRAALAVSCLGLLDEVRAALKMVLPAVYSKLEAEGIKCRCGGGRGYAETIIGSIYIYKYLCCEKAESHILSTWEEAKSSVLAGDTPVWKTCPYRMTRLCTTIADEI